jgi:hypothetical protein
MSINLAPAAFKINAQFLITKDLIKVLLFLFAFPLISSAQVGINTTTIDDSAILHVESTNKGVLFPGLTDVQMRGISSPASGLMVYCTDCCQNGAGAPYYYDGDWKSLVSNCEGPPVPLCIDITVSLPRRDHILNENVVFFDNLLQEDDYTVGVFERMRLHFASDQNKDTMNFDIVPDITAGYKVRVYWSRPDNSLQFLQIDVEGASTTSVDTSLPLPAGVTNTFTGADDDQILEIPVTAAFNRIVVKNIGNNGTGGVGDNHPRLIELQIIDPSGNVIDVCN